MKKNSLISKFLFPINVVSALKTDAEASRVQQLL